MATRRTSATPIPQPPKVRLTHPDWHRTYRVPVEYRGQVTHGVDKGKHVWGVLQPFGSVLIREGVVPFAETPLHNQILELNLVNA